MGFHIQTIQSISPGNARKAFCWKEILDFELQNMKECMSYLLYSGPSTEFLKGQSGKRCDKSVHLCSVLF